MNARKPRHRRGWRGFLREARRLDSRLGREDTYLGIARAVLTSRLFWAYVGSSLLLMLAAAGWTFGLGHTLP